MIVNAAILKDSVIYVGRRHCDILCDKSRQFGFLKNGQQGFITDKGIFLDRYAAATYAYSNGQIKEAKLRLCSEDL